MPPVCTPASQPTTQLEHDLAAEQRVLHGDPDAPSPQGVFAPPHDYCEWPRCGREGLCVGSWGFVVCSEHFKITNGIVRTVDVTPHGERPKTLLVPLDAQGVVIGQRTVGKITRSPSDLSADQHKFADDDLWVDGLEQIGSIR